MLSFNWRAHAPLLVSVLVSLLACSDDAGTGTSLAERAERGEDDVTTARVVRAFPTVQPLVDGAQRSPARIASEGFVLRGAPPTVAPAASSHGGSAALPGRASPPPALTARSGRIASDPLQVVAAGSAGIAIHRVGGGATTGRLDGGGVVYADAFHGADALVMSTRTGIEELLVVRDPKASIAYQVDLPTGWSLHHQNEIPGLVEVRDESNMTRLRMQADGAWDATGARVAVNTTVHDNQVEVNVSGPAVWPIVVDPEWRDGRTMALPRSQHTSTLLSNGKVLLAGGDLGNVGSCELYDPQSGTYTTTGTMLEPRFGHTATLLPNGQVLIAGGRPAVGSNALAHATAELYNPLTGTFTATASMTQTRSGHVATPLADGRILVTGGNTNVAPTILVVSPTAEVYDPKTGKFTATAKPMSTGRVGQTATLLKSGRVLVVGGVEVMEGVDGGEVPTTAAELFDPTTLTFIGDATPKESRSNHTATLLPSGDVLLVGGIVGATAAGGVPAEIYSVSNGTFAAVGSEQPAPAPPIASLSGHTASLLPSGKVLIAGGREGSSEAAVSAVRLYDPSVTNFVGTGTPVSDVMPEPAWRHTATLLPDGRVLMTGGESSGQILANGRIFADDVLTTFGSRPMQNRRAYHASVRLKNGQVLVVGGLISTDLNATASAEIYDPATDAYTATAPLVHGRYAFTATPLNSGVILIAGGEDGSSALSSAEIYDPSTGLFSEIASPMMAARAYFTATLLPSGSVLLDGGYDVGDGACPAEIYTPDASNPLGGTFACTSNAAQATLRMWHTATLLNSGKVLIAGGWLASTAEPFQDAEIFNPADQSFTPAGMMASRRFIHGATLLSTGQVLILGGRVFDATTLLQTTNAAELYDPVGGTFTAISPMTDRRALPLVAVLNSGKVLVAGGGKENMAAEPFFAGIATAEIYDPSTKTFQSIPSLAEPRAYSTINVLADGRALVIGGSPRGDHTRPTSLPIWTSELFTEASNPTQSSFRPAGGAVDVGQDPIAIPLPTNDVLVAGGLGTQQVPVATASLMDAHNPLQFKPIGSMSVPRSDAAAVLLDADTVLVTGGISSSGNATNSTELFSVSSHTFHAGASMNTARAGHTVTRLPSGDVLLVGGLDQTGADVTTAELYDPAKNTFTVVGQLNQARSHHTAALRPSGQVLIAGGVSVGVVDPPGTELYDPASHTFTALESPVVAGITSSSPLFSGDALIAGDGVTLLSAWQQPAFQFFSGTPNNAFGVQTLVSNDAVVCGADTCAWLSIPLSQVLSSQANYTFDTADGATAIRLPSTRLVVLSPAARNSSYAVAYQPSSNDVVRPVILGATAQIVAGSSRVTITGTGFIRATAIGSAGASPDPATIPVACFMPDQGGGPIFSSLLSWSDTSLEWLTPTTAYHGPGWVHVITNGVPSEGRFLVLPPSTTGQTCQYGSDCSTGFCVAGLGGAAATQICCDKACDGACEACSAKDQAPGGVDGICGPIAAETDPKDACEKAPQAGCQQTGVCNGKGTCECVGCRSNVDCNTGEVCAPDGQCEPYRESPTPADPGCSSAGGAGGSSGWLAILFGGLLGARRISSRTPKRRAKRSARRAARAPRPTGTID